MKRDPLLDLIMSKYGQPSTLDKATNDEITRIQGESPIVDENDDPYTRVSRKDFAPSVLPPDELPASEPEMEFTPASKQEAISIPKAVPSSMSKIEEMSSIEKPLSPSVSTSSPMIPPSSNESSMIEALKAAQLERSQGFNDALMDRGAEKFISGMTAFSGGKYSPDDARFKTLQEKSGLGVKAVEEQTKLDADLTKLTMDKLNSSSTKELSDPNSEVSKAYRALIKKTIGRDFPSTVSASQLESMRPLVEAQARANEAALDRSFRASEAQKDRDARKEEVKLKDTKEESKGLEKVKTENRKIRRELDKALPALDEQATKIKEAIKLIKDAGPLSGTGPIDQFVSANTPKGQAIRAALNSIALDTMVSMFSGMSKAIDSDSERAFFQSAQPSLGNYETTNLDLLQKSLDRVNRLKEKTLAAKQEYDQFGNFAIDRDTEPTNNKVGPTAQKQVFKTNEIEWE